MSFSSLVSFFVEERFKSRALVLGTRGVWGLIPVGRIFFGGWLLPFVQIYFVIPAKAGIPLLSTFVYAFG
jgi:hypothetical protein